MANHAGRHFAKVYEAFSKPAVGQGGTTWLELLISGGPCPVKITLFHWNSVSIHTLWLPQLTSVSYFSTWPDPHAQRLVSITTQRWVPEWVGGLYTCFSHRCLFPAAKYSLSSHTPPVLWCVWCRHWSVHLEQWRRQWTECSMIRTCVSSVERWDTSAWIALWMPADGSQKKV